MSKEPCTVQEFADRIVAEEYRQPLKTLEEAVTSVGWQFVDSPECCGAPVTVSGILGPYHAECGACGKFVRDVLGPIFGNACVRFPEPKMFSDFDTEKHWISGVAPKREAA